MNNETMKDGKRAAFEAWALNEAISIVRSAHNSDEYAYPAARASWKAWQARAAASQAALSDGQRAALGSAISALERNGWTDPATVIRDLLAQASTERMSDAAREGYRDYQDGMERENNPFLEPHSIGFQEWEKGWNAARKAEVERGEGQS